MHSLPRRSRPGQRRIDTEPGRLTEAWAEVAFNPHRNLSLTHMQNPVKNETLVILDRHFMSRVGVKAACTLHLNHFPPKRAATRFLLPLKTRSTWAAVTHYGNVGGSSAALFRR